MLIINIGNNLRIGSDIMKKKRKLLIVWMLVVIISLFIGLKNFQESILTYNTPTLGEKLAYKGVSEDDFIDDYSTSYHATNSKILKNGDNPYVQLNGDDKIVNIVPKSLFFKEGKTLDVLDDYGYFVNTLKTSTGTLYSSVIVFSIDINTNLKETVDKVISTITVEFEYTYVGLTPSTTTFVVDKVLINCTGLVNENYVLAIPSSMNNGTSSQPTYGFQEAFYLRDISVASTLFNLQSPNAGDVDYNPYEDYGCFFTAVDYEYSARILNDEMSSTDEAIFDLITTALGWLNNPIIDTALNAIELVQMSGDIRKIISDGISIANDDFTYNDKVITQKSLYTNRISQLENYMDEQMQPHLIKNISMVCNSKVDKNVCYGVGDKFSVQYTIGHDQSVDDVLATRIYNTICMQIQDVTGAVIYSGKDVIYSDFGYSSCNLTTNLSQNFKLLPSSKNTFKISLPFKCEVIINIKTNESGKYKVNGNEVNTSYYSFNMAYDKASNDELEIVIESGTELAGDISFSVKELSSNTIVQSGDSLYRLNYDEPININSGNDNIIIKYILELDADGNFNNAASDYYSFAESGGTFLLLPNHEYYVVLSNLGNTTRVNLKVSPLNEIFIDSEINLVASKNFIFYTITCDKNSIYNIIIDGNNRSDAIVIFDEEGKRVNLSMANFQYTVRLEVNKKYYIGFSDREDATACYISECGDYRWEVSTEDGTILEGEPNKYDLLLENKYYLLFYINNTMVDLEYSYASLHNYTAEIIDNLICFRYNTNCGGNGVDVYPVYDGFLINYALTIVPVVDEDELVIGVVYNEADVIVNINVPIGIRILYYKVYKQGDSNVTQGDITNYDVSLTKTYSVNVTNLYSYLFNISNTPIYFEITSYDVKGNALKNQKTINKPYNIICKINSLFAGGEGTLENPYLIYTSQQFKNMRLNVTNTHDKENVGQVPIVGFYKLMNDIYITTSSVSEIGLNVTTSDWLVGKYDLLGGLDGNYHIVRVDTFYIHKKYQIGGLFRINYGTIENLQINVNNIRFVEDANKEQNKDPKFYIGVLCGTNKGTVEHCTFNNVSNYNEIKIEIPNWNIDFGSICGSNQSIMNHCYSFSYITGYGNKGGVSGSNTGTITNCLADGRIECLYFDVNSTTQFMCGGICAYTLGTIMNCDSYVKVAYVGAESDSKTLQPMLGIIAGCSANDRVIDCIGYTGIDSGTLKEVHWTTGKLWWQEDHYFNQALYVGVIVGRYI